MADAGDLRRLVLALPGVSEAPHFDRAAFKAVRIFVTMPQDGLTANIKFTPDEQELKCLTHPEAFAVLPNAWGRQGWTVMSLANLTAGDLDAALRIAYVHGAEKKKRR